MVVALSKQGGQKVVTDFQPRIQLKRRIFHLRKNRDIQSVFRNEGRVDTPYFRLYYAEKKVETPRFLFAASRKVGCAAVRNKCKRRFYEIIRKNQYHLKEEYDMMFFINRRSYQHDYGAVELSLKKTLERLK